MTRFNLGNRIAPPRFVAFVVLSAAGFAALVGPWGLGRATMAGFDIGALVFLGSLVPLLRMAGADHIRALSKANDANRAVLLAITFAVMLVILVAVHGELKGKNDALAIALVITTLVLAWLFSNTVYTLHYAHLFYSAETDGGGDSGGLSFPECKEPAYWDFLYFSFTLGMTFQTSDVAITSRRLRRIVLGHSLMAFVFNLGILAFTINVLGGGGGS